MSENVKVNYYSVVPAEVKYNNELTERAKFIYGEISSLSNKMGDCLAMLVKENVGHLLYKINRDRIIGLYDECKLREQEYKNTDNEIISFINYFYKSLKNYLLQNKHFMYST